MTKRKIIEVIKMNGELPNRATLSQTADGKITFSVTVSAAKLETALYRVRAGFSNLKRYAKEREKS
jgi:hypothetical protein